MKYSYKIRRNSYYTTCAMTDFSLWLGKELDQRGWSRSEAARRGEISPSSLDKVMGGFGNPGVRFCRGIARAFQMSPEEVYRLAGLLPASSGSQRPPAQMGNNLSDREATAFGRLGVTDQELVVAMTERLAGLVEGRIIGDEGE
jgi:transcriptional regulator with XRE-family HTH domain